MIEQLNIKDYAIIKELNLDLHPGLTVITGETGSGKTILLDASPSNSLDAFAT